MSYYDDYPDEPFDALSITKAKAERMDALDRAARLEFAAAERLEDAPAAPGIPQSVLRMYPSTPADAWEYLSAHRYRAPHEQHPERSVWCVVIAFGETVGQTARRDDTEHQADVYAGLFEAAARLAAHRVSCAEGTPIVRPDDGVAGSGGTGWDRPKVAGRCWWCGKRPAEHAGGGEGS